MNLLLDQPYQAEVCDWYILKVNIRSYCVLQLSTRKKYCDQPKQDCFVPVNIFLVLTKLEIYSP